MRKDAIIIMMGIFVSVAILGRINFLDPVRDGSELEIYTNVHNNMKSDLDNLRVKAFFLDIGDFIVSKSFDLDAGDTEGIILSLDVPTTARKGDHLVKIVASNDDYHDSRYMYFSVI